MKAQTIIIGTAVLGLGGYAFYKIFTLKQTAESLDYVMSCKKISYSSGMVKFVCSLKLMNPTSNSLNLENCYVKILFQNSNFATINLLNRTLTIKPNGQTKIDNIPIEVDAMAMLPVLRTIGGAALDIVAAILTFNTNKIANSLENSKKQIIEQFIVNVVAQTNGVQLPTVTKQLQYESA